MWREFESLVEAGRVRQLGISNIYDLRALQNIYNDADVKPAVVQNRYSTPCLVGPVPAEWRSPVSSKVALEHVHEGL